MRNCSRSIFKLSRVATRPSLCEGFCDIKAQIFLNLGQMAGKTLFTAWHIINYDVTKVQYTDDVKTGNSIIVEISLKYYPYQILLAFSGQIFAGQTFAGQTFSSRTFSSRTFACQTFAGQTFAGQTFAGRTFAPLGKNEKLE